MVKKIFGILFFVVAVLVLIGFFGGGTMANMQGPAFAGLLVGVLLPVVTYILSGIFLCTFDQVYLKNYLEGFQLRKKQCTRILWFVIAYGLLFFMVSIGTVISGPDNYLLAYAKAALPYIIPLLVFAIMLGIYAVPFWRCQKLFRFDDAALNWYLSGNEIFYTYIADNSVLASNNLLFFPRTFCIIPFQQIAATKFYNAIEKDIIFTLTNGKKLEIVATKAQYDSVLSAISANAQNQQS